MNELRALLAGMRHAEQGSDFAHCRGVLADWLEERGDERGARLRSWDSTIRGVLMSPRIMENWLRLFLDLFPEVCICEDGKHTDDLCPSCRAVRVLANAQQLHALGVDLSREELRERYGFLPAQDD